MFILTSAECVELEEIDLSVNCLTYPNLFYLMEKSMLGRPCIFQHIVLVNEVFVREGWVNYKETNGKCNNGWSSI